MYMYLCGLVKGSSIYANECVFECLQACYLYIRMRDARAWHASMYLYICVYVFLCMFYAREQVCFHVFVYMYIYIYMCVCVSMYVYVHASSQEDAACLCPL